MSYADVQMDVIRFAESEGMIPHHTALGMARKTQEEIEVLMDALIRHDTRAAQAAYGDILISLIIGAACVDVDLVDSLKLGYRNLKQKD